MKELVWKGSAVLVIKPEKMAAFKIAVSKVIEPTRKEKGCICYEGFLVLDEVGEETNRFEFHEIWASKESMLIDHKENSLHMQTFFKEIKAGCDDSFLESFIVDGKYVFILESF